MKLIYSYCMRFLLNVEEHNTGLCFAKQHMENRRSISTGRNKFGNFNLIKTNLPYLNPDGHVVHDGLQNPRGTLVQDLHSNFE